LTDSTCPVEDRDRARTASTTIPATNRATTPMVWPRKTASKPERPDAVMPMAVGPMTIEKNSSRSGPEAETALARSTAAAPYQRPRWPDEAITRRASTNKTVPPAWPRYCRTLAPVRSPRTGRTINTSFRPSHVAPQRPAWVKPSINTWLPAPTMAEPSVVIGPGRRVDSTR